MRKLAVLIVLLAGCNKHAAPPAAASAAHPEVVLFPSAADAADGTWARGCARLMARQIDRTTGHDTAMVALVVGATSQRVGYALPSAPLSLDQASAAARRYGATRFARVHIYGPSKDVRNIFLDVFEVDGLKTVFSRAYPWNPHKDTPPLRAATGDLAAHLATTVDPQTLFDGAPFGETGNPLALEAFLGYLDNLTLAAAARGRPVGAGFRTPAELLDEAQAADPGFQTARALREQGQKAHFDRVYVSEIALKD